MFISYRPVCPGSSLRTAGKNFPGGQHINLRLPVRFSVGRRYRMARTPAARTGRVLARSCPAVLAGETPVSGFLPPRCSDSRHLMDPPGFCTWFRYMIQFLSVQLSRFGGNRLRAGSAGLFPDRQAHFSMKKKSFHGKKDVKLF